MAARLLVISSDEDMRKSLAFSLSAHGYSVVERSDALVDGSDHFDCTIIDEIVARQLGLGVGDFYRQHAPVVLLHYNSPSAEVAFCLQKPLRGDDILEAIESTLQGNGAAP